MDTWQRRAMNENVELPTKRKEGMRPAIPLLWLCQRFGHSPSSTTFDNYTQYVSDDKTLLQGSRNLTRNEQVILKITLQWKRWHGPSEKGEMMLMESEKAFPGEVNFARGPRRRVAIHPLDKSKRTPGSRREYEALKAGEQGAVKEGLATHRSTNPQIWFMCCDRHVLNFNEI